RNGRRQARPARRRRPRRRRHRGARARPRPGRRMWRGTHPPPRAIRGQPDAPARAVHRRWRSRRAAHMRTWLRIISLIEAAVLLAGFVVLIRLRPEWPQLPSSLSAPVTTTMVQQLVLVALWLSTALLLLLFLVGSI